jgi:hypothetical protein
VAYTSDLVDGAALLLTSAGLGVYRPTGPAYTPEETGIVIASMPDAPDRAICLTPYTVDDDVTSDAITGLQVRMRAGFDPRDLMALSDAVFDQLHNRRGFWLGAVNVAVSWRASEVLLGQDAHGRDERTSNYYLRTTRTSPHLYE